MRTLRELLDILVQRGGADLFLVVGQPPSIRVAGAVERLDQASLEAEEIENVVLSALAPHSVDRYRSEGYVDTALRLSELGRFRINLHHERARPAATIRAL